MVKKKFTFETEDDDNIILDKKAKRKLAKAQQQQQKAQSISQTDQVEENNFPKEVASDDVMSKIALLCQEFKWREAALLCKAAIRKQEENGTPDNAIGIQMALNKIDKSLRRQMAVALIKESKVLLKKEYLLDVGE